MTEIYKISFETVGSNKLHKYYNADPRYYSNTKVIVTASEVPEEDWHKVERESNDLSSIVDQYNGIVRLIDRGELIRNPKILKGVIRNDWTEIEVV